MSAIAGGVVLPRTANPAGAYQFNQALPVAAGQQVMTYRATGSWYEIVSTVFVQVVTDATVLNRIINLVVADSDGQALFQVPMVQPVTASSTWTATWAPGLQVSASSGNVVQTNSLPAVVLLPGWRIDWGFNNGVGTDHVLDASIVTQRFPSGGALGDVTPAAQPLVLGG